MCVDLSQKTRESLAGMNSPYPSMTSLFGSPSRAHMTPSSPFMGFPGLNFVFCYIYISGLRKKKGEHGFRKFLFLENLPCCFSPPSFFPPPAVTPKDSSVTKMMIQDNWCYALLEKYDHQPTQYLRNLLRDCDGEDLCKSIDSRVQKYAEKVFQASVDPHNTRYCIQV